MNHQEEEAEKAKVDLSPWLDMTADQIHEDLCGFFDRYPWSLLQDGKVSPKGGAYHDALIQLRDEKREYERICEFMEKNGLKSEIPEIENIDRTEIVYAECGCCKESGGDYNVFLSTGKIVEFDSYGSLINAKPSQSRFLWLKKGKK